MLKAFSIPLKTTNNGWNLEWTNERTMVIFLNSDLSDTRFLSILVHELSHLVDHMLENAFVKVVDTELRAYLIDHVFEMCLYRTKFHDVENSSRFDADCVK
jgi:Zn-dependent peptidase ImmA (M78 family)